MQKLLLINASAPNYSWGSIVVTTALSKELKTPKILFCTKIAIESFWKTNYEIETRELTIALKVMWQFFLKVVSHFSCVDDL